MTEAVANAPTEDEVVLQLHEGNLVTLNAKQKAQFLLRLCAYYGLNPLTKPFDLISQKGRAGQGDKLVPYANKSAAAQLRKNHAVDMDVLYAGPYCAMTKTPEGYVFGDPISTQLFMVVFEARRMEGERIITDIDIGVAAIGEKVTEDVENALKKAYTAGKRRVTLSVCGVGLQEPRDEQDEVGPAKVQVHAPGPPPLGEKTIDIPVVTVPAEPATKPEKAVKAANGRRKFAPAAPPVAGVTD